MQEEKKKYNYKSVRIDANIGKRFETHCDGLGLGMKESMDVVLSFLVDYNVSPDDLEYIWKKRTREELNHATNELMKVHNFGVGFLRTWERKQEQNWNDFKKFQLDFHANLITNITKVIQKYAIQEVVLNEILYDIQLILKLENEDFGNKVSKKNYDIIIKEERNILKPEQDKLES